jgi:hypothetical protein
VAGGREVVAKSRSTRRRRTYRYHSVSLVGAVNGAATVPWLAQWWLLVYSVMRGSRLPVPNALESGQRLPILYFDLFSGFCGLKGLPYEIDFENVDENWQILALTRFLNFSEAPLIFSWNKTSSFW